MKRIREFKVKIIHFFKKKNTHRFCFKIFIKIIFYFFKLHLPIIIVKINLKIVFITYSFKVNIKPYLPTVI